MSITYPINVGMVIIRSAEYFGLKQSIGLVLFLKYVVDTFQLLLTKNTKAKKKNRFLISTGPSLSSVVVELAKQYKSKIIFQG